MIHSIRAVLLDIEGTTTPISFVFDVLFPYVRTHIRAFLENHASDESVKADIAALAEESLADRAAGQSPPVIESDSDHRFIGSAVAYVNWLMDLDRKSTPLKSLQGRIWRFGYERGELSGEVFSDVPTALDRWRNQGKKVFIFSSGSVQAQKLLFANTNAGDLSHLIDGYFDTRLGAKTDNASYKKIAAEIDIQAGSILFVSDVTTELTAAALAGVCTALCIRPGNHPQPEDDSHLIIRSLTDLELEVEA